MKLLAPILIIIFYTTTSNAMEHYKKMKSDYWTIKQLADNKDINLEKLEKDLTLGTASQVIFGFFGAERLKEKYFNRLELVKQAKVLRDKKAD